MKNQRAFLFLPDDPRLRRYAAEIAAQRRHSLKKRRGDDDTDGTEFDDLGDAEREEQGGEEQMSLFAVISAVAEEAELAPSVFSTDHGDDWDDDAEVELDESLEVRLAVPPPRGARGAAPTTKTRKQLKKDLRDANAELVRELVRFSKLDHRQVNAELNRLAGIRKVTEATVEQLQTRLDRGERWLKKL
ncbi:MAG: hypothetical protein R2689_07560 [Microthrixaceae bacterium]